MAPCLLPLERRLLYNSASHRRLGDCLVAHARKQSKKNRGKAQTQQETDASGAAATRIVLEQLEELPKAPPPSSRPSTKSQTVSPDEIYPVFAPKPGSAQQSAPWRWDDDDDDSGSEEASSSQASDVPRWNPRTGFMKTAAELQAEAAAAAASGSPSSASGPVSSAVPAAAAAAGPGSASQAPPSHDAGVALGTQGVAGASADPAASRAQPGASTSGAAPLPFISRNAIISSALGTGFWMTILAIFFRNYAAMNSAAAMGTDPQAVAQLLRWPAGFESLTDVGICVGAAVGVTAARQLLMGVWSDLREATDRSNQQVLTPLSAADVVLVALASGIPEELLFRGALIPASFPDWRGVLIAAVIFGALHNSGGRNPAFALWAGAVGAVYGAAYVATGNIWVPAVAHAAANMASAFVWRSQRASAKAIGATGK